MKIAITAENNNGLESTVAHHFGHAPYFILVDVENGEVTASQSVGNPFLNGHAPGQVPGFIKEQNADVMLSGGMGGPSSSSSRSVSRRQPALPGPSARRWRITSVASLPKPRHVTKAWRTVTVNPDTEEQEF